MNRAAALGCLLLLAAGCHRVSPSSDPAREYIRLAVALGERDPDSLDYSIAPAGWVADVKAHPPSLVAIRTGALRLAHGRSRFLSRQLHAIAARCDLLQGRMLPFDKESEALFGITAPRANEHALAAIRHELPPKRYASLARRFTIPRNHVPAVMALAIQACRQRTAAKWKLPPGEAVALEYVSNRPWAAFSRYQGRYQSVIQINLDFDLTIDQALDLAAHEAYPGHHAFNSLRDQQLLQREGRWEFSVQPAFSPASLLSEAAATLAPEIVFPISERVRFERESLLSAAGLVNDTPGDGLEEYIREERLVHRLRPALPEIARQYLDGKLEFVRASAALEEQALTPAPDSMLKYLNQYRTYSVTYTTGRDLLADWMDRNVTGGADESAHWKTFGKLIRLEAIP